MSLFSERLKYYVNESDTTIYHLSKKGGIDRSTLHKSLTGERIPSQTFFDRLCDVLMLTPEEKKDFGELYAIARIGDDVYFRRKRVKALIQDLAAVEGAVAEAGHFDLRYPTLAPLTNGLRVLESKALIESAIMEMLGDAFGKDEKPEITLLMPFENKSVFDMLFSFFVNAKKEVHIDHIICLEKEKVGGSGGERNLSQLRQVLNFALSGKRGYAPYYYYADTMSTNAVGIMPYSLSTDHYVITLSKDMRTAVLYDEPSVVAMYKSHLKGTCRKLSPLTSTGDTAQLIYGYAWDSNFSYKMIMEEKPCMAQWYTQAFIDNVLEDIPGREEVLSVATRFYNSFREAEKVKGGIVSIFLKGAIADFMAEGDLPVPKQIARSLTLSERIAMMKKIRHSVELGKGNYKAIDCQGATLPKGIEIMVDHSDKILIRGLRSENRNEMVTIQLEEISLAEAFRDFFEYLLESELVLSDAALLSEIDDQIQKAEKNL